MIHALFGGSLLIALRRWLAPEHGVFEIACREQIE